MKKITILLVFLFISLFTFGQIGVSAGYKTMKADDWFIPINETASTNLESLSAVSFEVDYWFRLKNYRIEFLPGISIERYEEDLNPEKLGLQTAGIYFKTNIYFLDIEGDCNCPTFSKDGNFLTKGLFLQISPGWTFWDMDYENGDETFTVEANNFIIGVGVGIDIGISDLLTVSPIIRFSYLPSVDLEEQGIIADLNSSNITQLFAGLKLGIRWKQ